MAERRGLREGVDDWEAGLREVADEFARSLRRGASLRFSLVVDGRLRPQSGNTTRICKFFDFVARAAIVFPGRGVRRFVTVVRALLRCGEKPGQNIS